MAFNRSTTSQPSQPLDSDLTAIAALANTNSNFIVGNGSAWVAENGDTARISLGVGSTDSPYFTAVNIGAATDTTVTRASAGDINVEGNIVYRAGGTDVPIADGGTGASTLAAANIAVVTAADEWSAAQNFNSRSLTFDVTQDWNLETDQVCDLTLTANTTFDAPTNMKDGGFYSITIIQDGTGSRTAAWNSVFKWAAASAPTLTTTETTGKDIFVFRSDGTNMYEVGRQLDLR